MGSFSLVPIFMLLLAGINYGLIFPVNSLAALANATFLGHAFWQTMLSGTLLLTLVMIRGQVLSFSPVAIKAYFLVGIFGFSVPMSVLTLVAPKIPVGVASLVMGLSPSFTFILGVLIGIERISLLGILGIILGFIGLLILFLPELSLPSSDIIPWFSLALVTPICLAIANVSAGRFRPKGVTSLSMGAGFLLASAIAILPMLIIFDQFYWPINEEIVTPTLVASLINCVHIVLFAEIVKRYGPVFFSQFNYVVVIFAMIWAFILFKEIPSVALLLCLFFVGAGIALSGIRKR